MSDFKVTLEIAKVGDREAMAALNDLDAKGRKIVEAVSGATGKAMGDIAVAYEKGSARMRRALDDVAQGHRENVRELERQSRAAVAVERTTQALAARQATAAQSGARSLEAVSRAAQATGDGLNGIISQVSQLALGFGTTGPLVAAIGISTLAIVQMFQRAQQERTKLVVDLAADFERIANMSVVAQGRAAVKLYSGDANAGLDENGLPKLARFGVEELRRQQADLLRRSKETVSTVGASGASREELSAEARRAAAALKLVNSELKERNRLLASITGRGGSIERAGAEAAGAELAGFVTSGLKADAKADRKLETEAEREGKRVWAAAVKAFDRGIKDRQRDAKRDVAEMIGNMILRDDLLKGLFADAVPSAAAMKDLLSTIDRQISDAIDNDPFLQAQEAFKKRVKELAGFMSQTLASALGDGIAAGFAEAFRADGFQNPFAAFSQAVLNGLGSFMQQLGVQMLVVGLALESFATSLASLNGAGAIAAGIALIAAGAGLKAVAGSFGKSTPVTSGSSAGGAAGSAPRDFLSFGVSAGRTAIPVTSQSAPPLRENVGPNYFIGDGPQIQRALAGIINGAASRGLVKI